MQISHSAVDRKLPKVFTAPYGCNMMWCQCMNSLLRLCVSPSLFAFLFVSLFSCCMSLSGRRLKEVKAGEMFRNNTISWNKALAVVFIDASQSQGDF